MKWNFNRIIIYLFYSLTVLFGFVGWYYLIDTYFIPIAIGEKVIEFDFRSYYEAAANFTKHPISMYDSFQDPTKTSFIYPPLSMLIIGFLPNFNIVQAYFIFNFINLLFYVASLILLFELIKKGLKKELSIKFWQILLVSMSVAPLIQNFKMGQLNAIVLFVILLSLKLYQNNRLIAASFVLTLGFWIKVYPILLLPMYLIKLKGVKSSLLGFFLGFVLLPVLFFLWITPDTYYYYFTQVLPNISSNIIINPFNQSLTAVLMRLTNDSSLYLQWDYFAVPAIIKWINLSIMTLYLLLIYYLSLKSGKPKIEYTFSIMSAIGVFSSLGWEYTFILTLPIFVLLLNQMSTMKKRIFVITVITSLLFIIPKLPDSIIMELNRILPEWIMQIYYSRFLIFVLFSNAMILTCKSVHHQKVTKDIA